MRLDRRILAIGGATVALAAGGIGVADAVGGDSKEQVTGPEAEEAKTAALKAAGGGSVTEVERQDGDGAGVYEVEVKRADGTQVEIHLDGQYRPVGQAADDDSGSESDDDGEEGASD